MSKQSIKAQTNEKMIELRVRFWTNAIAETKGEIVPKHALDSGVVHIQRNESHGILPQNPLPFHSMMELMAVMEKVLIAHGIQLRPSRRSSKYFRSS